MITAQTQAYAELAPGAVIRFALKWQLFGLLLMASHVVLVKQSVFLFPIMMITVALLYYKAPLAGFVVYLQLLIYQNWIIGFLADNMSREPTFVMLQGTNFAALVMMAMIAWTRLTDSAWRSLRPIILVVLVAIVAATLYSTIGAAKEGVTSALIYFREFTSLVFAVLIGLDLGRVYGFRSIAVAFLTSVALSILLDCVEWSVPTIYYEVTNAVPFMLLKTINDPHFDVYYSVKDVIAHNESVLFNFSDSNLPITQLRFQGTVMHPISNAYVIAASALLAWASGYAGWLFVLVPLLLLSGVKGANLLFVCSVALWIVWTVSRSRLTLAVSGLVLMVSYLAFGLLFGQENGDYHVLGFLGGIHSFMANPLGHGIGVGGNLSANAASATIKWQNYQHTGASDIALESAVGVLLSQMGLAAMSIFAVFIVLIKKASFTQMANPQTLMFLALATVAVNGVYQEEAYAPTAAGLFTLLCAVIIANGDRPVGRLAPKWQPRAGTWTTVAHV